MSRLSKLLYINKYLCLFLCFCAMKTNKQKLKHKEQLFLNPQQSIEIPNYLQDIVKDRLIRVERVDFTGDGKLDYICYSTYGKDSKAHEYWVTNNFQIYFQRAFNYEVNEVRFLDLDNDKIPEVLSVFGNSRHISYALLKNIIKNNRFDTLFFFIPVILTKNNYYSSYVRGIDFIYLRKLPGKQNFALNVTFQHLLKRSKKSEGMRKQKYLPLVLFGGTGIKEIDKTKILEDFRWHNLAEISSQIRFAQQLLKEQKTKNKVKDSIKTLKSK